MLLFEVIVIRLKIIRFDLVAIEKKTQMEKDKVCENEGSMTNIG